MRNHGKKVSAIINDPGAAALAQELAQGGLAILDADAILGEPSLRVLERGHLVVDWRCQLLLPSIFHGNSKGYVV